MPRDGRTFWNAIHRLTQESLGRVSYASQLMSRLDHADVSDPALAGRMRLVVSRATGPQVVIWKRGQALGVDRKDLSAGTLIGIAQGIKEVLTRTWLADDRVLTKKQLSPFTDVQLDLVRRISEPRKEKSR